MASVSQRDVSDKLVWTGIIPREHVQRAALMWPPAAPRRRCARQSGGLPLLSEDGLHPGRHRPVRLSRAAGRGAVAVVEGTGRGLLGPREPPGKMPLPEKA